MKTTRIRVIDYLKKKGLSSAADLSRALKTTPANMRHHLSVLASEGAVTMVAQRPVNGRGRPARLYSLTSAAQSHNLDRLASALLDELGGAENRPVQGFVLIEDIARRMAGDVQLPGSLNQKLYSAVQRLNELHYQARWEARPAAPRIIFSHCPYSAILSEHPELCRMDAALLSKLLQVQAHLTHRLVQNSSGARQCIFSLLKQESQATTPENLSV